ncbi:hypothetical protein BD31_I0828 [Candidatus Nitrosopumilus salaria BD31]|uniref:Uncharacterized protein n=1 Tax=Candidatus Nitrosopumilus salarius BD31 TaxID=859350 RepID=I3D236_9ARCH|nr:hypothetical protein BD31_I0828 [Candidatus Nitrosopumilus salaria BD31]
MTINKLFNISYPLVPCIDSSNNFKIKSLIEIYIIGAML